MIRSDSYRDIDLTRNMTKRLCEASSIASLRCDSSCIINCRPISVLAVFQGTAVQGSSFFRLNEIDTAVTGLDWTWESKAVQPFRPHSTVLFFYSVSFGLRSLNGRTVHLSDDRPMNMETLTECNTGKHSFYRLKDDLCLLRIFFQADFKYVIRIASSQNNFFVAYVLKCSFTEFSFFFSPCQFVLNMVQTLYYISSTVRA